jgi:hypothetical protein
MTFDLHRATEETGKEGELDIRHSMCLSGDIISYGCYDNILHPSHRHSTSDELDDGDGKARALVFDTRRQSFN